MKASQKIVLAMTAILISGMLIYPPFQGTAPNGRVAHMGYDFIFHESYFAVNVPLLFAEWVAVLIVGGLIFLLLKNK